MNIYYKVFILLILIILWVAMYYNNKDANIIKSLSKYLILKNDLYL